MKQWRWLAPVAIMAGLVTVLSVAPVEGGGDSSKEVKFELNKGFKAGEEFYQKLETSTIQKMTVNDMQVVQKQEQEFHFKWKTTEVKDGIATVTQEIEALKMDIDIGSNKISYQTGKTDSKNPMTDFFKALEGAKFTMTIDLKEGKVTKVEGQEKLINDLGSVNQSMKPLLSKILSDEAVKQMANPIVGFYPKGGSIGVGKEWKPEPIVLEMGPIGTYKTTNTFTLTKDTTEDQAKIDVKTDLTYTKPEQGKSGGLPFEITEAKLESKNATGKIVFDRKKGRIASSEMSVDLQGSVTVKIAGSQTQVNLDQTQTTKLETMATKPKF